VETSREYAGGQGSTLNDILKREIIEPPSKINVNAPVLPRKSYNYTKTSESNEKL